jgi:hypothetical protein
MIGSVIVSCGRGGRGCRCGSGRPHHRIHRPIIIIIIHGHERFLFFLSLYRKLDDSFDFVIQGRKDTSKDKLKEDRWDDSRYDTIRREEYVITVATDTAVESVIVVVGVTIVIELKDSVQYRVHDATTGRTQ